MSVFGEMHVDQSRSVYDDDEDELIKEDENLKRKIYWLTDDYQQSKLKVDDLIVADGAFGSAFVYTYLLAHLTENKLKLLALTGTKSDYNIYQTNKGDLVRKDNQQSLSKLRTNYIYLIENLNGKSYLICQLFNQLKANETYDWIDQLWSRIEFKTSIVLCNQNKASYFGSNVEKFPCVKFLASDSSNEGDEQITRLEEPNFIGNLPAALIHFSMLKSLPFTTFICYSSSLSPDLQSLKETFNGVTRRLKDKSAFLENENSKKILLSIGSIVNSVSALYM